MDTSAVILEGPHRMRTGTVRLMDPGPGDLVIRVTHSGISTGTEKLFWNGRMPPFPGMGYPLVPGYESVGEVVEACGKFRAGDRVFVPGANCFEDARGLFGGSAGTLVTAASRVARIDAGHGAEGSLLALAATACHAMSTPGAHLPELIVGHGVLGRLLARLTLALGGRAPTVWDVDPSRRTGARGYEVMAPEDDPRRDYNSIYDASGSTDVLNELVSRCAKGAEVTLAGFYADELHFAFPPAFMREVRLRIAAEWMPTDLVVTRDLIECGSLSLAGLITHEACAANAANAYRTAFEDPACLKMILTWEGSA